NKTTWMALIRGLYIAGYYEEALTQIEVAREHCGDKPDFRYFQSALLFELGKTKEALLHLETALNAAAHRIRVFTSLNPEFLRRTAVSELVAKYKNRKK